MESEFVEAMSRVVRGDGTAGLSRRFTKGEVVRVAVRAYVETERWVEASYRQRFLMTVAGVLVTRPSAVFTHLTALALAHPGMPDPETIDVATHSRGHAGSRDAVFAVAGTTSLARRARALPAVPVRVRLVPERRQIFQDGFRRDDVLHALIGVLSEGGWRALAAADAVRRSLRFGSRFDAEALGRLIAEIPRERTRRRASGLWITSTADSESVAESRSRFLMLDAGLPVPELQHEFYDDDGFIARADFWWEFLHLVGECDGISKYVDAGMGNGRSTYQRLRAEKERDSRLMAKGERPLHWGASALETPEVFVARLRAQGLVPELSTRPWP